jgi:hypothetical protein
MVEFFINASSTLAVVLLLVNLKGAGSNYTPSLFLKDGSNNEPFVAVLIDIGD